MTLRTDIGVPQSARHVQVDGVDLAVQVEGQGPAVVCLHATGHGGRDFEAFAREMSGDYQIVRLDWPGQGRSGSDREPATPARYAWLLEGVLEQLGITRPILIGNSIGGATAIHYATRHPVAALVLCDAGGLVPVNTVTRAFCRGMSRLFAAGARNPAWFRRSFRFYYERLVLPSSAAKEQRERIIAAAHELSPVLASAWHHFGEPEADIRQLAASLRVPVWCAWARQDRVIPLWLCRPALKKVPDMRLTMFEGGHAAFLEQPEAFAAGFRQFMASLESRA